MDDSDGEPTLVADPNEGSERVQVHGYQDQDDSYHHGFRDAYNGSSETTVVTIEPGSMEKGE